MEQLTIRRETAADYRAVEELTRRAFWNLYVPGCTEHYVAHILRGHPDFIPELDLVLELDGNLIGNVMYTRAKLVDADGVEKAVLTFGPVCIDPAYQRQGYGRRLLEYSFAQAVRLGYDTIVIFGSPANYVGCGFQSCKKFNVCLEGGIFPAAMMVKELTSGALDRRTWVYRQSPAMEFDAAQAEEFDKTFTPMEKGWQPSQEEFYIQSNATLG